MKRADPRGGAGPSGHHSTSRIPGRVPAVDPWPAQFLVVLGGDGAALVVAVPPGDLVRLAVLLAPGLPPPGPAGVRLGRLPLLLVPKQGLALAVALHAQRHGRER